MIGEVAAAVGVPPRTVRFYERRGLLPEPARARNGYRIYDGSTIDRLRFIRSAQAAGFTLAEIGSIVELRDAGETPCEHVDGLIHAKLADVRSRRRELDALEAELRHLAERSRALDPADCSASSICQILQVDDA